jgi:hypothetical protein
MRFRFDNWTTRTLSAHIPLVRASHVGAVRQGADTVLIDVERGAYHTLNEVGTRVWELLATPITITAIGRQLCNEYDSSDVGAEQINRDVGTLVHQLSSQGLLKSGPRPGSRARIPIVHAVAHRTNGALREPSTMFCGMLIALIRASLRAAGYERTTRWVMRRASRTPLTSGHDRAVIAATEYRVALAAAFYPGRAECLERSLALYYCLRSSGVAVAFRVGVQAYPFTAHAWIEYDRLPINDIPEHVARFHPIAEGAS